VNLEHFDEWKDEPNFLLDVMKFLDNVMDDFIERAGKQPEFKDAVYSASRERSVGLGVMGFHSLLQKHSIAFESLDASELNQRVFRHIHDQLETVNVLLAHERGSCPDARDAGIIARFSNMTAVAPTASISTIAGNSSPGIETWVANTFIQKTLSGSFAVRNRQLANVLRKYGADNEAMWQSIIKMKGSVQHLPFLSDHEKKVYRTAFEIDQLWVVKLANDRGPWIQQGQSVNIFLPPDVSKQYLSDVHFAAYEGGSKSLYYLRSFSLRRAESDNIPTPNHVAGEERRGEECLACQ
jgi:ribonucleoside-diphosphate reductase alpha chain